MLPIIKPHKDGYVAFYPNNRKYQKLSAAECEIVDSCLSSMKDADDYGELVVDELSVNLTAPRYTFIPSKTPLKIFWDVTDGCNAMCIHCFTNSGLQSPDELTTEQIYTAIDKLSRMGIMSIAFSGGEPFVRKDMLQIIKYATDRNFIVSMTTNGSLLANDTIDALVDMGVKSITFSLDGMTQEIYGKIRRGLDLSALLDNIMYSTHCAKDSDVEISVRTTINPINMNEVAQIAEFCSKIGVDSYKINNTNLWGRAKDSPSLKLAEDEFKSVLMVLNEKKDDSNCKIELPIEKYLTDAQDKKGLGRCTSTIDTINIFPNGDIGACGFCERRLILGNVATDDICDVLTKNLPFDFDNEVCNACEINKYKDKKRVSSVTHFVS